MDSSAGIINTYFAKEIVGSLLFEERIENIKNVSKEDIINICKKIHFHTEYLLVANSIEGDTIEED